MKSWHDNPQLRHPLFLPLLLVVVILAVYYPAIFSGIHTIDDPGIVELYASSPSLSQILLPGGYYYRPLLELSFWLDNRLWGMEPVTMHLENLLLHCLNGVLVFLLARRLCAGACSSTVSRTAPLLPLSAALLFALHPVNTEAVSWIAGRSDPLLAAMVLLACWFWLSWLDAPRWHFLAAAILFFLAALLTKETALAAGPVAVLMALAWRGAATARQRIAALALLAAPILLLLLLSLIFRSSAIKVFAAAGGAELGEGVREGALALGFYARKLLAPLPLNFAITEVAPLHLVAGLALPPFLGWLLWKRRLPGALFASAALLVLPAVLVAVKQVAWTPYAERYLYLPCAFFTLGLCAWLRPQWPDSRRVQALLALLLVIFAGITFQRNLLWNDKLAFLNDTIAKSPQHGSLYSQLGTVLMQRGEVDRALEAFTAAERLNKRESVKPVINQNLMGARYVKGEYAAVRAQFFELFKEKRQAPLQFLELLHKSDSRRLALLRGEEKALLARDLLETLDLMNQKRYDPFWLYRMGQISLEIGEEGRAAACFSRAYAAAPVDAHYRKAAGIYLEKLGKTQ